MPDVRQYRRVEFDRRAWCEHPSLTLYLAVSNVSTGGMFLQTTTVFEPGERLKVSFEGAEPSDRIVAHVEIVWVDRAGREPGVGCSLIGFLHGEDAYAKLVEGLSARGTRPSQGAQVAPCLLHSTDAPAPKVRVE